jgi:hypothetical protein
MTVDSRGSKTATEVLNIMAERFTSGNAIPVERAHVSRSEWDPIVAELMSPSRSDEIERLQKLLKYKDAYIAGMIQGLKDADALEKRADGTTGAIAVEDGFEEVLHQTYPGEPIAGIYEAGMAIVRLGKDDEATGE